MRFAIISRVENQSGRAPRSGPKKAGRGLGASGDRLLYHGIARIELGIPVESRYAAAAGQSERSLPRPAAPICTNIPPHTPPQPDKRMNNADLIVATLKSAGVQRGFGIPSGNVLPLMEAMRKGGVDFVLTAHEGSAGFAADVTGRMTGAPGLCIATLGPGATNLATGVGCAWLDRSPMIAITCNLNTDQLGRRIQMWIDHHALFKPITKATMRLEKGRIGEILTQALRLALSEPKGPVHLDLPE